jgi:hypothetical protein
VFLGSYDAFTSIGRANPDSTHHVVMMLRGNLTESTRLPEYLMDVSDPHSPNYGKHWSFEKMRVFANKTNFDLALNAIARRGVLVSLLLEAGRSLLLSVALCSHQR